MLFLKFSIILLFFTFNTAAREYLYHVCSNTTTFAGNNNYRNNLNLLLSSLSSNATRSNVNGLYNTSVRQYPNDIYGLFLCRGDASIKVCQDCVFNTTKNIVRLCPSEKEAIIWYDMCLLRYSNRSFFSTSDKTPSVYMWNIPNVTVNAKFNQLLATTLTAAAAEATNREYGMRNFAVKKVNYTSVDTLHVLVQCTPQLSSSVCYQCLTSAIARFPKLLDLKCRGRVLFPSCNTRFGFSEFYNETRIIAPPPATPSRRGGKKGKSTWIKIGATLSAILGVVLFGFCIYRMCSWKILRKEEEHNHEVQLLHNLGRGTIDDLSKGNIEGEMRPQDFPLIPLDVVLHATEHFSDKNKLGRGGFGPVYKGTLEDGKEIAVKRLSKTSVQGNQEFMNEIKLIARLQHRNLVRLLGCCLQRNEKLLVYEYMPNKSLDFFLFDPKMGEQLDWQRRVSVINGIARGLLYLHEDSRLRIIQRPQSRQCFTRS